MEQSNKPCKWLLGAGGIARDVAIVCRSRYHRNHGHYI